MGIITVTNTTDSGSGSLRSAIDRAESGDRIVFANNLKNKTIRLTSGQITLDKNLTIDGTGTPGVAISGNNTSRVFYLKKTRQAKFKNLTIADGKTEGAGGGIDARHESVLELENVTVRNNKSELGGGMRLGHLAKATIINSHFIGNDGTLSDKYAGFSGGAIAHKESRGQLIIKGTTFEDNVGHNGGAIYSFASVAFKVEDSIFKNNTAKYKGGGAIFTDGVSAKNYDSGLSSEGKIVIRSSQFRGNKAKGEGGALLLWGYTKQAGYEDDHAIIEDSLFIGNSVTENKQRKASGGAIWSKMHLDIRDVTFARNTAEKQGGGLWTETKLPVKIFNSTFSENRAIRDAGGAVFIHKSGPVNIANSTIAYNKAGRASGGLWYSREHDVTLKNSIVAFNWASDRTDKQVGFSANDGGGNVELSRGDRPVRVVEGSTIVDPGLGDLTWKNGSLVHPLSPDSPVVKAGALQGRPVAKAKSRQSSFSIAALQSEMVPVAHLNFSESSGRIAGDKATVGLKNPGQLLGNPTWKPDIKDGVIALDGKGDVVQLNNSKDINLGIHRERTVSILFKADSTNTSSKRQVLYEEGGSARGLNIYLDRDKLYVGGWNTPNKESGWTGTWLSTDRVSDKQWHRVDLILSGGSQVKENALVGYLDGQKFGSGRGSQLWEHRNGIGIGGINGQTRFHGGIIGTSGSEFAGKVDELTILNEALTSTEINSSLL
ncbi:MAG: right-handed parallel beta-helix repeat-containing protein [Cyanobacteria bacterium J06634_6]